MDDIFTNNKGVISDYGSDLDSDEERVLFKLLSQPPEFDAPLISTEELQVGDHELPQSARLLRQIWREQHDDRVQAKLEAHILKGEQNAASFEVAGDGGAKQTVESQESRSIRQPSISVDSTNEGTDHRTPLERFRTKPKKALSVTDLVSPSWCELQYWYTLTKYGSKRPTTAMRQGSAVHKTLEAQVFQTVRIDIQTREDAWGLRIWNVIQGLRAIRETGMTRELELWGVVDGLVVNGIIDELSYICPDTQLEENTARAALGESEQNAVEQPNTADSLGSNGSQEATNGGVGTIRSVQKTVEKIYLTDVKTRGYKSIPSGVSFRPTLLQLMIYRLLLSELATNKVDAEIVFDRYGLDSTVRFSDHFVAQLGSFNESYQLASSDLSHSSAMDDPSQDSMQLLLNHNSIRSLWDLMIEEFQRTMPAGADSIGDIMKVEYRDQKDGSILGTKTISYDKAVIVEYISEEIRWWRGEREARGVDIEEAYKCRSCEFAEGCVWRISKIEEATKAYRTRSRRTI